jgi:mannitol 2-dehydrogenase
MTAAFAGRMSPIELSAATLDLIGKVAHVPTYDRSTLRTGIAHVGVGGFHRAHQAMYIDRLMNAWSAQDWAICGVGVQPTDRRMRDTLAAQDYLYTLIEKGGPRDDRPRVIGAIIDYTFVPDDPTRAVVRLTDPAIQIVSLTITEGGYNVADATRLFNCDTPEIAADLKRPDAPHTVFGLVTSALAHRRRQKTPPFTVVSCDNLAGNGDVARTAFTTFAREADPDLADWMQQTVCFPNSMVDRITPVTTEADRAVLRLRDGVDDRWPVVCEPFTEWVLEDMFSGGRPPLEEVGVRMVSDVEPYEQMKLRLLNAGHQALGYFGVLCGHEFVHEAATDPLIAAFVERYMDEEAAPTIRRVSAGDLGHFRRPLMSRFANHAIRDTLQRICTDGSDRIPKFVLPVVREQLKARGHITCCAAIIASWARYAEGLTDQGVRFRVHDRQVDRVQALVRQQHSDPLAFIADRQIFGQLADDDRFVSAYERASTSLHQRGARATLEALA